MDTSDPQAELRERLASFADGTDRSRGNVAELEALVLASRDSGLDELGAALASWEPAGSEYLYDSEGLARVIREALHDLDDHRLCEHSLAVRSD